MIEPQSGPENKNSNEEEREESVAERSARLEAEAQKLYQTKSPVSQDAAQDEDNDSAETIENYQSAADEADGAGQNPSTAHAVDNTEVEALKAELAAAKDQMLRVAAEAENTKRRALRDRDDAGKFAIQNFAKDIVNVADNLRRALEAIPDDLKEDVRVGNLTEGIEATERELLRSFEKNGIVKLNPIGEVFDPNFHEVMFEAPMPDKAPGTVIEVVETGYTLHGRLVRPARVGVAKDDGQSGGEGGNNSAAPSADPGSNIDTEA